MPLPHFTQLQMTGSPGGPGSKPQEPVWLNLFELTFVLPVILQAQGRDPVLLLQQATNINLNLTDGFGTEVKDQRFKYSTRAFVSTPNRTHYDFDVNFNVNVNDQGSMETYNTLRAWYDLVWNSQNGYVHYKADCIGTIIVNQHDKKGLVLRRVTFQNCQMTGLSGIDLKWDSSELWQVNAKFVSDYWIDEWIDNNFTIQPPFVGGY